MTQEHPITPPQWQVDVCVRILRRTGLTQQQIADRLNLSRYRVRKALACGYHPSVATDLRTARRPKPPSLKELALKSLKNIDDACESEGFSRADDTDIIRRALESLPE